MRILSALLLTALLASTASAHIGYKIKMEAQYKETKKGSETFRNIFVTGHGHYPDGTLLIVMIRPENGGYLPLTVRVPVKKQEFAAEMGPWREGFPAGKYVCEAWFELEKQSDAVKEALKAEDEFSKCLLNNPAYQEEYKKENPERYEKLMAVITATGKCSSNRQFGACPLVIGTIEEASQSTEAEKAYIRDHASLAKDMLSDLMKTYAKHADPNKGSDATVDTYKQWSAEFQSQIAGIGQEIDTRINGSIFCEHREAFGTLSNALMALQHLESNLGVSLYGDTASAYAQLKVIEATPDSKLDKDQRRQRTALKKQLAASENERSDAEKRAVESLAQTLFGPGGLEPAPARVKTWVDEVKAEFGFEWKE